MPFGVSAGEKENVLLQKKALSDYEGASKSLSKVMACLKGKSYPDDIEECGVSSFGDVEDFQQVSSCLLANTAQRATPIAGPDVDELKGIALAIDCKNRRVLIVFKKRGEFFFVDGINFMLD